MLTPLNQLFFMWQVLTIQKLCMIKKFYKFYDIRFFFWINVNMFLNKTKSLTWKVLGAGNKFFWNVNINYKCRGQYDKYCKSKMQSSIWISQNNKNAQNLLPAISKIIAIQASNLKSSNILERVDIVDLLTLRMNVVSILCTSVQVYTQILSLISQNDFYKDIKYSIV